MDTRKIPPPAPDYGPPPKRHRARKVAIILGILLGVPALALAATYLFGVISGSAIVQDSSASLQLMAVYGTDATGGISNAAATDGVTLPAADPAHPLGGLNCSGSSKLNTTVNTQQTMAIFATAYRVNVNGQQPAAALSLGTCYVLVKVHNDGARANVAAVVDPIAGWTFTPSTLPDPVEAGADAVISIKVEAMGNALGTNAGPAAPITGKLNVTIPPSGS